VPTAQRSSLLFADHSRSQGDAVDYAVFAYCKLWLRTQAPQLSVDHIEVEINVLAASVLPTALVGAIVLTGPGGAGAGLTAVVLGIVLAALWTCLRAAARLRRRERFEAVRNLCFAHLVQTATGPAA
jgi:hypothetical protein